MSGKIKKGAVVVAFVVPVVNVTVAFAQTAPGQGGAGPGGRPDLLRRPAESR